MKKQKVVALKSLPMRLPILSTAVCYLLLDRFHVPGWAWGVAATIVVIVWIIAIISMVQSEHVELFKDG